MRQFGLIHRRQALEDGLTSRQIEHRLRSGLWRSIHPQVYAINGAPPTWQQELLAACFWGEGLASHRSAGALWELPGQYQSPLLLDVTVTRCHLPARAGIRIHHTDRLLASDRHVLQAIPTTGIERTLMDLGAVSPRAKVAIALDAALARGLTTPNRIDRYLAMVARRGRRGCKPLRELLRERASLTRVPQSPLETSFFDLLVAEGLPKPELQYEIRDRGRLIARVDFAWPDQKMILEMDGYRYHSGHSQWQKDRRRRNELTRLGWTMLHGTWADLEDDPQTLLKHVSARLLPHLF